MRRKFHCLKVEAWNKKNFLRFWVCGWLMFGLGVITSNYIAVLFGFSIGLLSGYASDVLDNITSIWVTTENVILV